MIQIPLYTILDTYMKQLHTGRSIPQIGFGTYQLRGQNCFKATLSALIHGYRHIDTASIYTNEEAICQAIQASNLSRKQLYITSKIAPSQQGFKQTKEACHVILKKLQCQYLDLLLIHWPGVSKVKVDSPENQIQRLETWRAMIQLQKEGKVKDIGVSNFLKHHLERLAAKSQIIPVINQLEIHPLLWEQNTIEYCRKNNIILQSYSPLARASQQLLMNPIIREIAVKYKKSAAQICLRWGIQQQFVILPKSAHSQRIKQNIQLWDFSLTTEQIQKITSLKNLQIRTCWDPHSITI